MTTLSITSGQGEQLIRFTVDATKRAATNALKEASLDNPGAQRVIERGDDYQAAIERAALAALKDLSVSDRYADQVVKSTNVYPLEYRGPKSIRAQVEGLLTHFSNLNAAWALDHGQAWYDSIKPGLPKWIEGPLVYVWWEVFGDYHAALQQVLDRIAASRTFYNYCAGAIGPKHLRQLDRTARMEKVVKTLQPGDFIIVPSQAGLCHRGESVLRARELFLAQEFGLGGVAEGCRALTHPERYVRWEQLHTDPAGDEYSPDADGEFSEAPFLDFDDGEVGFGTDHVSYPDEHYGSSSAFLPQ